MLSAPYPAAITIQSQSKESASSLFLFLLFQTLHNVEREPTFSDIPAAKYCCETFILEAASFSRDNKIVGQVARKIMELMHNIKRRS